MGFSFIIKKFIKKNGLGICKTKSAIIYKGFLGMHKFWARNEFVQAKLMLVKLFASTFSKLLPVKS